MKPPILPGRAVGVVVEKVGGKKHNAEGGLKNESGGKGSGKAPSELQDSKLKHNTAEGARICWNWNLAKGCSFAKAGQSCREGVLTFACVVLDPTHFSNARLTSVMSDYPRSARLRLFPLLPWRVLWSRNPLLLFSSAAASVELT